jgi:hypothetical protein
MSRAFVKEVEHEIDDLPDRPLSVHPNLVTAEGFAAIERTLSRFEAANKAAVAKNDRTAAILSQNAGLLSICAQQNHDGLLPRADVLAPIAAQRCAPNGDA